MASESGFDESPTGYFQPQVYIDILFLLVHFSYMHQACFHTNSERIFKVASLNLILKAGNTVSVVENVHPLTWLSFCCGIAETHQRCCASSATHHNVGEPAENKTKLIIAATRNPHCISLANLP